ncbi:serine hydrolase domain-containing protein [Paradesertivirga mongoliensis]|uniref:Serine hydrolase domain-containing protein n=1 Tax=Paradesertivirga mongoliensis TaxID=2100740 RepID=A0ABW4ZPW0_9SPHI|nr:serine hydrolase [Pedobacter mongoliensis]
MKKVFSYTLVIAFFFCASNTVAQSKTAANPQRFTENTDLRKVGTSPAKIKSIDSLMQSFVDQKKVSSVVGFVAKGGNIVYKKAFGWKDIENRVPATPDDYYIKFSQTKAVTSVAFMTLVEKGLVKVDDPVSKYFPGISDQVVTAVNSDGTYETRPAARPMTFAHLLSHSSGLGAGLVGKIRQIERRKADSIRKASGAPASATVPGQRTAGTARYLKNDMEALAKYPLGFDPGSEWNYHVSTNMLGYMIERISGKPLREYIKETILTPLGMNDTDWYFEPKKLSRFVKVYNAVNGNLEPASNMYAQGTISKEQTYAEGAIGLNGPIQDYAKFCQMLLNKGTFNGKRILKAETIDQMTKINQLPEKNSGGKGFKFGLGFELYNQDKKPAPEVSNSAYAWGGLYGTEYIIDPENDLIALFYLNMPKRETLYPKFLSKAYQLFK